jgi:hypothetical protein
MIGSIRMIVNLVILALVSLWFSYQMLFFPISIFNRLHMMQALKSLDWLVQWDDVVIGDTGALSEISSGADNHGRFGNSNTCIWKSHKCYFQVLTLCCLVTGVILYN